MVNKFKCNQMHPLHGAHLCPFSWVTRGALVAPRNTYESPRCKTSQYRMTFIAFSASLWNDLADPVFDCEGLVGFKSRA